MSPAGLLGMVGEPLDPERTAAAVERAPWRGQPRTVVAGEAGALVALGGAQGGRSGPVAAVLHGRIDNAEHLGRELGTHSREPWRLAIEAYLREGDEFAARLVGDFAILVLDERRGCLLAARDWVGARPLFWGRRGSQVAFASEVKQVLALVGAALEIDEETLARYEAYELADLDATFAKDVRAVPPTGQVRAGRGAPVAWRRTLRFEQVDLAPAEAALAVCERLRIAVARRAAGAERLGAIVSGGLDSSSVAASAPPLHAVFSAVFPEVAACDESAFARAVAERLGVPWVPVSVMANDALAWPECGLSLHDGPAYPTFFLIAQVIGAAGARGIDALLVGQGGDHVLDRPGRELEQAILWGDLAGAARWTVHAARRGRLPLSTLARGRRGLTATRPFERTPERWWLRLALEAEEREGMRWGVRVEFPFLDIELAALLAGLPPRLRSAPGQSKLVLRHAMAGALPSAVLCRQGKTEFSPLLAAATGIGEGRAAGRAVFEHYASAWRAVHP